MPEKRKSSQGCGKARPAATHGFKALPFEEDKDPFEDFDDRLDEENLEDLDEYDDYDDCDGVNLGFARELPKPSPRTPPTLPPDTALGEEEEDEEGENSANGRWQSWDRERDGESKREPEGWPEGEQVADGEEDEKHSRAEDQGGEQEPEKFPFWKIDTPLLSV